MKYFNNTRIESQSRKMDTLLWGYHISLIATYFLLDIETISQDTKKYHKHEAPHTMFPKYGKKNRQTMANQIPHMKPPTNQNKEELQQKTALKHLVKKKKKKKILGYWTSFTHVDRTFNANLMQPQIINIIGPCNGPLTASEKRHNETHQSN